ncbi:SH3 domain protein [Ophiocordyceps camponoti-floridani]|uniref:SH3 domain protein n=1 Tax=Ophiocordyceps camponoti-floridani TaxID=2030778 RepID=A0A8H4VDB9_9HYPO|nr:SH3 domain protein [Ophiocordyceps camponoti-floridani]
MVLEGHHRSLHDRRDVYEQLRQMEDGQFNDNDLPRLSQSSRGNGLHGHGHRPHAAKHAPLKTVVETVYKTLDPTFAGPIGGYVTLSEGVNRPDASDLARPPASDRKLAHIDNQASPVIALSTPTSEPPRDDGHSSSSSFDSALATPTSMSVTATAESSLSSLTWPTPSSGSPSISAPTSSPTSSNGRAAADLYRGSKGDHGGGNGASVGPKVGIAFGVMGGLAALSLLVFFLLKRRRKQAAKGYKLEDDEKSRKGFGISNPFDSSNRDNPGAPRISLRPVTQFLPNWNGLDRRTSRGAMAAPPGSSQGNQWDRPVNPFDNVPSTIAEEQSVRSFSTSSGSSNGSPKGASGGAKPNRTSPPPGSVPTSTSPTGTEYSLSSIASEAAATVPRVSIVHRVQLDFKPTLEDEMELCVGELMRLLHEYDDGWCLVSRLNRSHQGVVPRTCLSTRPVKPRQQPGAPRPGPPVNPTGPGRGPNQGVGLRTQTPGPGGNYRQAPSPQRPGTAQGFRPGPSGVDGAPMNRPGWQQGPTKPLYRTSPTKPTFDGQKPMNT